MKSTKPKVKVRGSFPKLSTNVTLTMPLSPLSGLRFFLFPMSVLGKVVPILFWQSGIAYLSLHSCLHLHQLAFTSWAAHLAPSPGLRATESSEGRRQRGNLQVCLEYLPTAPLTAQTLEETAPMCLCEQALELSHKAFPVAVLQRLLN